MEALQEGVDLRLDGASHPQLCHQLHVLRLDTRRRQDSQGGAQRQMLADGPCDTFKMKYDQA